MFFVKAGAIGQNGVAAASDINSTALGGADFDRGPILFGFGAFVHRAKVYSKMHSSSNRIE
jgi:hypothetical protein